MADFLRKLVDKDTIISTASAGQLVSNPKQVENYYSEIAATHMCLGNTDELSKKILRRLVDNQKTFNGAVVGEYGFGKTSLLIYLWDNCIKNSVLAIPPYQWSKFMDHFQVVYSWTSYILGKTSSEVADKFDGVFKKRIQPSIDIKAEEWASSHKISLDAAKDIIENEVRNGRIDLELKPSDLMDFCKEVSEFLLKNTDWQGLLVITDELQQTISELNRNKVFDYLFEITNHLTGARGNYGFLWGFPSNTHADLGNTRGDILDRLNSNGAFVRLSDIYDINFPIYLWEKYCEVFDISQEKYPVVDRATLTAIGQICDGSRRDIGNGPRSTISAFKVMANHYLGTQSTYKVNDFVEDCLAREISLGENSDYAKRINDVLALDNLGEKNGAIIKFLAAFPAGIPESVLRDYGREEELSEFIKLTGGLGKVVTKNITSYMLKVMRPKSVDSEESALEAEIRQFYNEYSPDAKYKQNAHRIFDNILEKYIFTDFKGSGALEKWNSSGWTYKNSVHGCIFNGTFNQSYPERKISILTGSNTVEVLNHTADDSHLNLTILINENEKKNKILKINEKTYQLNLDLMNQYVSLGNHQMNDIIPEEKQSPLLLLCLISHLESASIPNNEFPQRDHLIETLNKNIIFNIFNEELLGEIEGSEIELDSQGEYIIRDLFNSAMMELYPEYSTIMFNRNWKNKINLYTNALKQDQDHWGLMEKRGKEQVIFSSDKNENKEIIAKLFGQSATNFEAWLSGMDNLVEYKFDTKNTFFRLKCHPLEIKIIDKIQSEANSKYINGIECKYISLDNSIINEFFQMGYLQEEILEIIQIGCYRKYFNIETSQRLIYIKPEDQDELKANCRDFAILVKEQIEKLDGFPDYKTNFEELTEVESKIDAIESGEQAERIQDSLKRLQSYNKHYSAKELGNLKTDATLIIRKVEDKNNELGKLKNKLEEIKNSIAGKAPWIPDLIPIITNLNNEILDLKPKIEESKRNFTKISNVQPLNNKNVVTQYIDEKQKMHDYEEVWNDICQSYNDTEKRIGHLNKWIQIRKLHDQILDDIYKYEIIIDSTLKEQLKTLNIKIGDQLKNNYKSTLENNEQYTSLFNEIRTELHSVVNNSKNNWNVMCEQYETKIKTIIGKEPDWRLRWTTPTESFSDLHKRVEEELVRYLERLEKNFSSLNDDITYSIEVLNHRKAIQNKGINVQLEVSLKKISEAQKSDIAGIIKEIPLFDSLIEELKNLNEIYSNINRDHRNIIQPIKVKEAKEQIVLDLISKDDNLDLKKIIIAYQKRSQEEIDLTTSRDEVLMLMKELFLKNQISILIKKGKF